MTDNSHKKPVEMYIPSYNFEQFEHRPKANFKIILNKERKGKIMSQNFNEKQQEPPLNLTQYVDNPWVEHSSHPKEEGHYIARVDEYDEEDEYMKVEVKDGRAYYNGSDRFFMNYEWQKQFN